MKNLFLFLVPAALLFSCNVEMSADQMRTQSEKQCINKLAKKYLEADATDADKEKFCECYADYMVGDAEVLTMKEMMKKATNAEDLGNAMEACKTSVSMDVLDEDEVNDAIEEGTDAEMEDMENMDDMDADDVDM